MSVINALDFVPVDGYEVFSYKQEFRSVKQYGCKHFCSHEKHIHLNQLWRISLNKIFCRQCGYYTTRIDHQTCYCCGKNMAYAETRCNRSRKINNKNKMRY